MTQVAINRVGTDSTVLELMQTGSSETSANLRHALLDDKLNYSFSVVALSVPLNRAPIHPVSETTELFRVERRNVGQNNAADITILTLNSQLNHLVSTVLSEHLDQLLLIQLNNVFIWFFLRITSSIVLKIILLTKTL